VGRVAADWSDGATAGGVVNAASAPDADLDGLPDDLDADDDNDGFNDGNESSIRTDPRVPCGTNGWPLDIIPAGFQPNHANVEDLGSFITPARRLNTSPGDSNFHDRWDLKPGTTFVKWINVGDLAAYISGQTGFPPMLSGAKAFGSECPLTP
jgi:hypothetical protein